MAGIVVVANASTSAQGTWQYSADGSTSWIAIGTGVSTTAGVYLPARYSLSFNPLANWNGTPGQLTVRLVDSSSAAPATASSVDLNTAGTSGGTTIYSNSVNAVTLVTTIVAMNDAPVASGSSTLTAVDEDAASPAGATVTSLFTGNFSDVTDTVTSGSTANTLAGVAITEYTADAAKGEWQYTSDGSTWSTISTVTAASSALTYASADRLRFVPALNFNGAVPSLTVILIESPTVVTTNATVDVSARGGTTVYSSGTVVLSHSITAVNDAPLVTAPASLTVTEDVTSNLLFTGTPFVDVDAASGNLTVTLSLSDGTITAGAATGITVGGTTTARTVTGTLSVLNTYFTTSGNITYLSDASNYTNNNITISIKSIS